MKENLNDFLEDLANNTPNVDQFDHIDKLKESDVKIIIDGYGLFPYFKHELLFIPQLFYKEIILPFGIQSTQLHINYWDDKYFKNFENFIKKNEMKIINLDYILDITNPNYLQKITNFLVEKTLKTARLLK